VAERRLFHWRLVSGLYTNVHLHLRKSGQKAPLPVLVAKTYIRCMVFCLEQFLAWFVISRLCSANFCSSSSFAFAFFFFSW